MGELRHRVSPSERTVKQNMQRSRRQPFFTANHVGHLHQMVVYDVGQMVGRQFVGTLVKHLIVENGRVDDHIAANHVVHMYVLARLYLEPDDVLPAFGQQPLHLVSRQRQRIAHHTARRGIVLEILDFLPLGLQFFRRVEGDISLTGIQQLLHVFLVNVPAFRLTVRTMLPTETYSFVERNAEPTERFQNVFLRSRDKPVGVCVLDTENELAAMLACKKIIV